MFDQSFNKDTLHWSLQKSDFIKHPELYKELDKLAAIASAVASAATQFNASNPLQAFHHKKRTMYRVNTLANELVIRKLTLNLRKALRFTSPGRNSIINNLASLLSEGVPYRVYKFDIKSFYDSIDQADLLRKIATIPRLSPVSVNLTNAIINHYAVNGGKGIPRGLAISATLAELALKEFDEKMAHRPGVYYFARYVDDIVTITSGKEVQEVFIENLSAALPPGLKLNESKMQVVSLNKPVEPQNKISNGKPAAADKWIEFLGYRFTVREPEKNTMQSKGAMHRLVDVDISKQKIKKLKTRITKSFLRFSKDGDYPTLRSRITYLSSNFSIHDYKTGKRKLAGIYYSYPQLTSDRSQSLRILNAFLKKAIFSKNGRLFSQTSAKLSKQQKRELLTANFAKRHSARTFVNFSTQEIGKIQECWRHE